MTRNSEKVKLFCTKSEELVEATLYEDLTDKNLRDHEDVWIPQLHKASQEAARKGKPNPAGDSNWLWRNKIAVSAGQKGYRFYAVEIEDYTVGLMRINFISHFKSKTEAGKDLVYIDYIAVSPCCREPIQSPPRYKGIGQILFHTAIEDSLQEGLDGRVGLHSLSESKSWYEEKLKLNFLGNDSSYHNAPYLELTKERAKQLRDERGLE